MFDNLSLDMFGYLMPKDSPPPNLRDFQRQKLYTFEEATLQKHPLNQDLTLTECTTLARKYNPKVKVKDGRGRRHAEQIDGAISTSHSRCAYEKFHIAIIIQIEASYNR